MQPIVKDTKKDVARPAHPDTHAKSTPDRSERGRINRIANEMAGRGLERERKDEEGKDIIVNSDPHGTKP
ncbi:MAG TPA: hypothetical protein VH139_05615 [Acidobacteriaceae bacterium]|jgi:hypothetical protein|nr:hypothetical protein [Acidobacteriaceae bacterium]